MTQGCTLVGEAILKRVAGVHVQLFSLFILISRKLSVAKSVFFSEYIKNFINLAQTSAYKFLPVRGRYSAILNFFESDESVYVST